VLTRKTRAGKPTGAVSVAGRVAPLSRGDVIRAVETVLRRERRDADLSIAFVGAARMRRLNAQWKGADRATDVLAFSLSGPDGRLTGDVYVCPAVAKGEAELRDIGLADELLRLVIHGTLHVLGYDHPEGEGRTRSAMWRRQERYLAWIR
jgi:probable rRNA maturation factor